MTVGVDLGVKKVADNIWLVSLMHYDLGYFDHQTCRLESAETPSAQRR
jgi:putative transposase